ncbi:lipopolysaccharide biosynthesis protein [Bacillus paranthracis]|uniref:lipopolysaccharide biosynthesis protein n=1 Tax=Bacillus paranthracis TaxID=2026186 RepID=UPI00398D3B53
MFSGSIINIIIRGLTLLSRFILIFFIAKYLTPNELGVFGIFSVTVNLSVLLIGLDFYMYSTREIINSPKGSHSGIIKTQFVFHLVSYCIFLPVLSLIFYLDILESQYLVIFLLLVIFEHISQELYRIYSALEKPITANILLFIRSASWIYILILIFIFNKESRNLDLIWIFWIGGSFVSIVCGVLWLKNQLDFKCIKNIDFRWIKKGVIRSIPFFIATIALKGIEFSDRYILKFYYDDGMVGIYTFFINISNVIPVFIFSGISMFLYPKIIRFYNEKKYDEYYKNLKKMTLYSTYSAVVLSIIMIILLKVIIILLGKNDYEQYDKIFYIMLMTSFVSVLGQVPNYILYAKKKDKEILFSTLMGFIASLILNFIFIPIYGVYGAAFGNLCATLVMVFSKVFFSLKFRIKEV